MNELSAVSAAELDQVTGGIVPVIVVGVAVLVGGCIGDLEEAGEPWPGFDDFLANAKRMQYPR